MLPKEQRAALLSTKEYMSLWRRGVLDKVVASQRALQNFMAYGYDPGYIKSAIYDLTQAMKTLEDDEHANSQVHPS